MKTTLILFLVIVIAWNSEGVVKNYPEVIGGSPWHVAIYEKKYFGYTNACSGTILTKKIVITHVDCFSGSLNTSKDPDNFWIAAGKILREWNDEEETAQKKKVIKIIKQAGFSLFDGLFKDDLALVIIDSPFEFNDNVKAINLDFSIFEDGRIKKDAIGKVVEWGLLPANSDPDTNILRTLKIPVVDDKESCRDKLHSMDQFFLIEEKLCCGYLNETTDCITDKGSGLVFPYEKDGKTEYYLRGLVRPNILVFKKTGCESTGVYLLTDIIHHRKFIEDNLNDNK